MEHGIRIIRGDDRLHPLGLSQGGDPLIALSVPIGATVVGLPLAAAMFTAGWTFQFVGHVFEGKKPSFVDDRRNLLVGPLWWLKKAGVSVDLAS